MAVPTTQSDVFKFVALRPPTPPSRDAASINFTYDDREAAQTPVGHFVSQFSPDNAASIPDKLKAFIADQRYDLAYPQSSGDKTLDEALSAARSVPSAIVSTNALIAAIQSATGKTIQDLYSSGAATNALHGVWDRYYAFYMLSGFVGQDLTQLTTNLRTFHLLNILQRGQSVPDVATLSAILGATPVVDKLFASLPKPKPTVPPPPDPLPPEKAAQFAALWKDLVQTNQALGDVRGLGVVTTTETKTETAPVAHLPLSGPASAVTPARGRSRAKAAAKTPSASVATRGATAKLTTIGVKVSIDPGAFESLPDSTRTLLSSLRISRDNLVKSDAIMKLTERMQSLVSAADGTEDPRFLGLMPPGASSIRGINYLTNSLSRFALPPVVIGGLFDSVRGEIKPLGIGDLKVVKQKLISYQLGEVAHIENVLRGESKERKYRVLDRTEQTLDVTQETSQETEKDTQTTERFELQKATESTIQEQMSVEAGVTVSGSYGMVTIGAHGDFAYGTSSQQSSKTASNFAREVVDKSVSKIQQSVKTEQITKQLHEVEEIDTHGLDNRGQPDNLTGVYRWVDKYFEAQIYNYGKRLMFEFIIPEPAAFYGYAQTHQPVDTIVAPPPLPARLTHKDITETNYQGYIRDYRVQGCTPPPVETKVVSVTLSSDAKIDNGTPLAKASKELVVPDGYTCDSLAASLSFIYENYPQFKLAVGADNFWYFLNTIGAGLKKVDWVSGGTYDFNGVIPVAIDIYDVNSYFVTVVANCSRDWQTYETWQIQTFEKIMAAYQALKADYDQKVAQQKAQQGVVHSRPEPPDQPPDREGGAQEGLRQAADGQLAVRLVRRNGAVRRQPAGFRHPSGGRRGKDPAVLRAGVRVGEHHLSVLSVLLGPGEPVGVEDQHLRRGSAVHPIPPGRGCAHRRARAPRLQ
jgi:hypothetical protein